LINDHGHNAAGSDPGSDCQRDPVLVLLTALVTAPPMALAIDPWSVGTVVPTLTLAGMLSVAITEEPK